jgi:hypothetical protein
VFWREDPSERWIEQASLLSLRAEHVHLVYLIFCYVPPDELFLRQALYWALLENPIVPLLLLEDPSLVTIWDAMTQEMRGL